MWYFYSKSNFCISIVKSIIVSVILFDYYFYVWYLNDYMHIIHALNVKLFLFVGNNLLRVGEFKKFILINLKNIFLIFGSI